MIRKQKLILVGPFVGEVFWELFRFAPHIISIKKENPQKLFAVFTRPDRFDLYGTYASIFVPLRIKNDLIETQTCFKSENFSTDLYNSLVVFFKDTYRKQYYIEDHIYPDVGWRYNLKWQFPRDKMDYDFKPRKENVNIVNTIVHGLERIVLIEDFNESIIEQLYKHNYNPIYVEKVKSFYHPNTTSVTFLGCTIELLKQSEFIVCKTKSILGRLSLLLKKPIITIDEKLDFDELNLINPFKTKVISCNLLKKGIDFYENNLRP